MFFFFFIDLFLQNECVYINTNSLVILEQLPIVQTINFITVK